MSVALVIQPAKRMRYIIFLCGLSDCAIFPQYIINGMIFGKKITEHEMCSDFSLLRLSKAFSILRRIHRVIVINVKTTLCKVPVILTRF